MKRREHRDVTVSKRAFLASPWVQLRSRWGPGVRRNNPTACRADFVSSKTIKRCDPKGDAFPSVDADHQDDCNEGDTFQHLATHWSRRFLSSRAGLGRAPSPEA